MYLPEKCTCHREREQVGRVTWIGLFSISCYVWSIALCRGGQGDIKMFDKGWPPHTGFNYTTTWTSTKLKVWLILVYLCWRWDLNKLLIYFSFLLLALLQVCWSKCYEILHFLVARYFIHYLFYVLFTAKEKP